MRYSCVVFEDENIWKEKSLPMMWVEIESIKTIATNTQTDIHYELNKGLEYIFYQRHTVSCSTEQEIELIGSY